MEIPGHKRLMVFSGSANENLAREVANILGTDLGGVERSVFANGEIYIHYTDRQTARQEPRHAKFFDEFGDLVRDENSLDRLSSGQISISALSTIGLDLLSMDIAHFVMTPNDSSSEAVGVWQSRLAVGRHDVLNTDDSPESWLATIDHKYPARSRAVFLGAD